MLMSDKQVTYSMRLDKDFHKRLKLFSIEQEKPIKEMFIEDMEKRMAEAEAKKETK